MNEELRGTVDTAMISLWLARARSNGSKCFICDRIVEMNGPGSEEIRSIRLSGIELAPETQIAHLSRCVGCGSGGA